MAAAGAVVAEALRAVAEHARPGRSTAELDKVAAQVLARHGAPHQPRSVAPKSTETRSPSASTAPPLGTPCTTASASTTVRRS